jgi:tetratricopeptide (TPR) repeat protein
MMYQVGYYPHNIHFFVASASMEGRRADAMRAATEMQSKSHPDMVRDPAMGGMIQHFQLTPLFTMVRFGMWDDVLAQPSPADDLRYMKGMWHAARGLAYAAGKRLPESEKERTALAALKDDPELEKLYVSSVNTGASVLDVAYELLAGELAARQRKVTDAVRHFDQAAALEDNLTYMEPPDWPIPVRQLQGAALLELGRAKEAEAAFRSDMRKFPNNGWSLSGLEASLERQGRKSEAVEVKARLDQAWRAADTKVVAARPRHGN